jgi:PAS domain S-box-containing protein
MPLQHARRATKSRPALYLNKDEVVNVGIEELNRVSAELIAERFKREAAEAALLDKEAEFSDFVENGALGLHRVAGDGTILWANKAELKLLGYADDEYVGQHIGKFHTSQSVISDILTRLTNGETIVDYPATLRCKDGAVKHVLIHSNARFEDGNLKSTRCFTRDVTDAVVARELELQLSLEREEAVQRFQAADKAKDEFLAVLGHELRNPLAPIVTAMDLLRRRGLLGDSRELKIIERQVQHMVRLVDDLLDVQKIIKGEITLRMANVEISEVLNKAVEVVSTFAEEKEQTLQIDFEPSGLMWRGDPARLTQVVTNLLINASRYSPLRTKIVLSAVKVEDEIRISVKDEGNGIAEDVLPDIFRMFYQGPQIGSTMKSGLGIGLALCKSLVNVHGGDIHAHSDGLGKGSEFIMRLPVDLEIELPAGSSNGSPVDGVETFGQRILLVDDNKDAADVLSEILEYHGHTVVTVYDPVAALNIAKELCPQIVLTDIGLPVMDGYELAKLLREELKDVEPRIFAISGFGQTVDKEQSKQAGFSGHFVKPIDFEILLAAIKN